MNDFDLETSIKLDKTICEKCKDELYAKKLYGSLTNMQWIHKDVMSILQEDYWTASFRYVAGMIAEIRKSNEDYMDWYCSSPEGTVAPEVKEDLARLGWHPVDYHD